MRCSVRSPRRPAKDSSTRSIRLAKRVSLTVTLELAGDLAPDSIEAAVAELVEKLDGVRASLGEHESMTLTSTSTSVTGVLERCHADA